MQLDVHCPYCREKNAFKVELEKVKGAVVGPYVQHCLSCGAEIDLLKLAIVNLGPTPEPPASVSAPAS